ncbi:MAG: indole-3-glycerol phosphate synthase TrpC [Cellvibrionales bacterium]|nr:indole-3-glycerol phosphate synthase TrpC [Cellvibrionales bacterium]
MSDTPDVLKKIIQRKYEEISEREAKVSIQTLEKKAVMQSACRGFMAALQQKHQAGKSAIIAEIKKASPSKGIIREDFNPLEIAKAYEAAGAACLSVLTDQDYFKGHEDFLIAAREATSLPVIRKDFLVEPYQIVEARAIGADCVLLIVAAFLSQPNKLKHLYDLAISLNMDVLVEVHNAEELALALELGLQVVGINNRNLHNFDTSLQTTLDLKKLIPPSVTIVTESGIHNAADVALMRNNNIHTFLVGEAFMRFDDPGEGLKQLFE